jgi:plasmid stability protein
LDEDIAAKLRTEARRSGKSFRSVVNETLRRGLLARKVSARSKVSLPQFALGLRAGIDLDNAELLLSDLSRS